MENDLYKIKMLKDPFNHLKKQLSLDLNNSSQCKISFGAYTFIYALVLVWQLFYNIRVFM